MPRAVGVLALQGDFGEHVEALRRLGVCAVEVRLPADLDAVDALIIPGGESTAISRLLRRWNLHSPIIDCVKDGMSVWGTCAGAILLAERCDDPEIEGLGLMDIEVHRNAFGRQVDSFEADLEVPVLGPDAFHGIFIRAPRIVQTGPNVEALATLADHSVASARQANMLVTTFHPELTVDLRFHQFFLQIAAAQASHNSVFTSTID